MQSLRFIRRVSLFRFSTNRDNHFGFKDIATEQKQPLVNSVFHSVASSYDVMNDLMSVGIHRYWKNYMVESLGKLSTEKIFSDSARKTASDTRLVLDVAGGTGDIAFRILENNKGTNVKVIVLDINESMLAQGRRRAQALQLTNQKIEFVLGNAQELPFRDLTFDAYTIAFGLRNVPRTSIAVNQARRILKKGGRFMCLEFSKVKQFPLGQLYKAYNFNVVPLIGEYVAKDRSSYQYLVESIERFYDQEALLKIMEQQGLKECKYQNLTKGVVALHSGYKL